MGTAALFNNISKYLKESEQIEKENEKDKYYINYISADSAEWKCSNTGKKINTSFKVFEEGMDVSEYRYEDELQDYIIEE